MADDIQANTTELACFEILAHVGTAKSAYIEAIDHARLGEFDAARKLMAEGDAEFHKGHECHFSMLQKDASGEQKAEFSLILLHTEDQMAEAEMLKTVATSFIGSYELLYEKLG